MQRKQRTLIILSMHVLDFVLYSVSYFFIGRNQNCLIVILFFYMLEEFSKFI